MNPKQVARRAHHAQYLVCECHVYISIRIEKSRNLSSIQRQLPVPDRSVKRQDVVQSGPKNLLAISIKKLLLHTQIDPKWFTSELSKCSSNIFLVRVCQTLWIHLLSFVCAYVSGVNHTNPSSLDSFRDGTLGILRDNVACLPSRYPTISTGGGG